MKNVMIVVGVIAAIVLGKGIRCSISIESVQEYRILASYDLTIDASVETEHREVRFQGTSTFRRQTPGTDETAASQRLFPK